MHEFQMRMGEDHVRASLKYALNKHDQWVNNLHEGLGFAQPDNKVNPGPPDTAPLLNQFCEHFLSNLQLLPTN